jgi:hypothetical protein
VIPETIKMANFQDLPTTGGIKYGEIPIKPGKGEIALLLATNWNLYFTEVNAMYAVIWRKSYPKTSSVSLFNQPGFKSPDILDYELFSVKQETAVGVWRSSRSKYKVYPYPIVLVRPPQIVYVNSVAGAGGLAIQAYYILQRASQTEIDRLLAKDHD